MNYYILDDDENIVKILKNIVESDFKHKVVGFSTDPKVAIDEIIRLHPDVVLIDYLMPVMDGVDVIRSIKPLLDDLEFIMISQVSDKEMVADAYGEGLSFFINKPINRLEVTSVIGQVENHIQTGRKLDQIISLIGGTPGKLKGPKTILREVGMYSEKGSKELLLIAESMKNNSTSVEIALDQYMAYQTESVKIIRQRMRRAILKGLRNVASLGIEDYMSENFVKYSSTLYDFENVKQEMDFLSGYSERRGSVSVERFIENLSEF